MRGVVPLVLALVAPLVAGTTKITKTTKATKISCRADSSCSSVTSWSWFRSAAATGDCDVTWDGAGDRELRLRLAVEGGAPVVRELATRARGGAWRTLAADVRPEFRVVSGLRRMSNQQMQPLRELGVEVTPAVVAEKKWDAFWDAPLDLSAPARGRGGAEFTGNPPPAQGIAGQPGLPRQAGEIERATATFASDRCEVKREGRRTTMAFPGLRLGVFDGSLEFTVYRGASLIKMEAIVRTERPSVAYKYDAGLSGLTIGDGARLAWRDTANTWQGYRFGGAVNEREVPLRAANRLLVAERGAAGSIAVLPPPHTFFWAREIATNLGYVWYRKDSDRSFSFGVRQAEREETPQYDANFALYSARPGTWQHMAVFFLASPDPASTAAAQALALTHGDRYTALPGYQVMNHHYHMDLGQRLLRAGSLDAEIPDLHALKALGLTIVSQIDSVGTGGGRGGGPDPLAVTAASVEGARRHSDRDFLVMPDQEFYNSPLGGHTDLLFSHPVYWTQGRAAGQPLSEPHPAYGTVYHIASADDLMQMATREDTIVSMPHPRTKGSTGFPDAVKDTAAFRDPRYHGVGFRWGMGLDLSERRLCEYRCLPLLDDMSNWLAATSTPLKNIISISEARYQAPGDDIYASAPVTYLRLAALPAPPDLSPVIHALQRGDSFVTSGEVLIAGFALQGSGAARAIDADVDYTFPLEMMEMVWGDGTRVGRTVVSGADAPPSGRQHVHLAIDAAARWVRFAAWDVAGNGALTQPMRLP
jgi:hypothetical protein